jgi:hypothetical protein
VKGREPEPVRRFPPKLVDLVWNREIDPGRVFDLTLPLDEVAEGYRVMGERPRHQDAAAAMRVGPRQTRHPQAVRRRTCWETSPDVFERPHRRFAHAEGRARQRCGIVDATGGSTIKSSPASRQVRLGFGERALVSALRAQDGDLRD